MDFTRGSVNKQACDRSVPYSLIRGFQYLRICIQNKNGETGTISFTLLMQMICEKSQLKGPPVKCLVCEIAGEKLGKRIKFDKLITY